MDMVGYFRVFGSLAAPTSGFWIPTLGSGKDSHGESCLFRHPHKSWPSTRVTDSAGLGLLLKCATGCYITILAF
jgi:hypothetical protein